MLKSTGWRHGRKLQVIIYVEHQSGVTESQPSTAKSRLLNGSQRCTFDHFRSLLHYICIWTRWLGAAQTNPLGAFVGESHRAHQSASAFSELDNDFISHIAEESLYSVRMCLRSDCDFPWQSAIHRGKKGNRVMSEDSVTACDWILEGDEAEAEKGFFDGVSRGAEGGCTFIKKKKKKKTLAQSDGSLNLLFAMSGL